MNKLKILSLMIVAGAIVPGAAIAKTIPNGGNIPQNFDHVFTKGYESQIRGKEKTGYRFTYSVAKSGEVTLKLRKKNKNGRKALRNIIDNPITNVNFFCVNKYSNNSHWRNYKKVGAVARKGIDADGKTFSVKWTPDKVQNIEFESKSHVNHTCVAKVSDNEGNFDAVFKRLDLQ